MNKEAFEAKFKGMPYCLSMKKDEEGDYTSFDTKMAWEGWCAAMSHVLQVLMEEEVPLNTADTLEWPEGKGEAFRRNVCNTLFEEFSPFWKD